MPAATRKPQPSRQERREEIAQQLFEATERLMGEGLTYTELRVDRLATEAGISRATFYLYFEDKGQLLRRLAERVFAELADASHQWLTVAEPKDLDHTRDSIAAVIATYRQHQALITAVIEMASYDAEVAQTHRRLIDEIAATLQASIEQRQAEGTTLALPAREVAIALTWMVERTVHQTVRFTPPSEDARLAEALAHIAWNALEPSSRTT
jgi:AcrR family transcriptional regulator